MKIGFDGRFFMRQESGNRAFSEGLVDALSQIDGENEYTVYLRNDGLQIPAGSNFRWKRMSRFHKNPYSRFLFTFPRELARDKPDIFHAVYTIPAFVRADVVLSLIECAWFTNPEHFPASRLFQAQLGLLSRYAIKKARTVIVPGEFIKSKFLGYFQVPEEKVEIVPLGVQESFFERSSNREITAAKADHGISGRYILSVGNLHPRKNFERLIEAFTRLKRESRVPHKLVIIGKTVWSYEGIFAKVSEAGMEDGVVFTGFVPDEHLRALYQGAEIFVFPSLYEGFGLPVLEAMASGLPVACSRESTLPEVVGEAGLLFDPLDIEAIKGSMNQLLEDEGLRERLRQDGLERAKTFSWKEAAEKTVQVYKRIHECHG